MQVFFSLIFRPVITTILACYYLFFLSACNKSQDSFNQPPLSQSSSLRDSQGIHEEKIIVTGKGSSEKEAISDALVNALSKIQGVTITSDVKRSIKESRFSLSGQKGENKERHYVNDVTTSESGFIKDYSVVEVSQSGFLIFKEYSVKLEVSIPPKYYAGTEMKRVKIAIVTFRSNNLSSEQVYAKTWISDLEIAMVQSGRFAMLDRSFSDVTKDETDQYSNGDYSNQELARTGARVGTDYIVTGNILKGTKDNTVSLRIIDVATGQVKFAKNYIGKSIDAFNDIIEYFYPLTLIGLNGQDVIIGQGGESMQVGQQYTVISLGESLKDPYTGETIGRVETPIGVIEVTSSSFKTSGAKIITGLSEIQIKIKDRLILRKEGVRSEQGGIDHANVKQKPHIMKKSTEILW